MWGLKKKRKKYQSMKSKHVKVINVIILCNIIVIRDRKCTYICRRQGLKNVQVTRSTLISPQILTNLEKRKKYQSMKSKHEVINISLFYAIYS